jgi:plasmid stabilization system protein ParE
MGYRLRIASDVWLQADAIDSWWRAHRRASPELFRDELEAALERLETTPLATRSYGHEGQPSTLRRVLLPRTRYFVYFEIDGECVTVLAVWHGSRGKGPTL